MKRGDLIQVKYNLDDACYHGVVIETPEDGPRCVWRMWCIERETEHIFTPRRDNIKVISEA